MVPCLLVTDWHADSGQKIKKSPMSIFALKNPLYPKIVLILVVILTTPIFLFSNFCSALVITTLIEIGAL